MNTQALFALRGHNPDVLTCIANLSNDEVFMPPEFANRMPDAVYALDKEHHAFAPTGRPVIIQGNALGKESTTFQL